MRTASLSTSPDFLKLLAHDVRWSLVGALTRGDHRVHELVQLLGAIDSALTLEALFGPIAKLGGVCLSVFANPTTCGGGCHDAAVDRRMR